jgi:PAS domain-containing protein
MEELQTTQEESARRELDMNGILGALNSSYLVMELDLNAEIININENAKNLLNVTGSAEGHNLRSFLKQEELDEFEKMWQTIIKGESVHKHHNIVRSGRSYIISESYTPIYNDMDEIYKILNLGVELENN